MSAPRDEALGLVRGVLDERAKTIAQLREATGLGHDDLTATLDVLRESGEAFESEVPGEWSSTPEAFTEPELPDEDGQPEHRPPPRPQGVEDAGRPSRAYLGERSEAGAGEVVLTMAIAGALDAETIGKLVEAGIAEAKDADRAFVLRVEP